MSDVYTSYYLWRFGGSLFSLGITIAIVLCIVSCCRKKRRQEAAHNLVAVTTVSGAYPHLYQPGAPLPPGAHVPVIVGTAPYDPTPYPTVPIAAPPYEPPIKDRPPSYSVAIRGERAQEMPERKQTTDEERRHAERASSSRQLGHDKSQRWSNGHGESGKKGKSQRRSRSQEARSAKKEESQKRSRSQEQGTGKGKKKRK